MKTAAKKIIPIAAAFLVVAIAVTVIIFASRTSADSSEERSLFPRIATGYEVPVGRYYIDGDTSKAYINFTETTYQLICDDYEKFKEESIIAMGAQNHPQSSIDRCFSQLMDKVEYIPVEVGYPDSDVYATFIGLKSDEFGEDYVPSSGYNFYPDPERPAFGHYGYKFYYVPESEYGE